MSLNKLLSLILFLPHHDLGSPDFHFLEDNRQEFPTQDEDRYDQCDII